MYRGLIHETVFCCQVNIFLLSSTSCSKLEFGLDYLHHLRARLTQPLIARVRNYICHCMAYNNILCLVLPTLTHTCTHKGLDGVADVVSSMEHYDLMRSDWDLVSEMGQFKGKPDHAAQIPSKVST